MTNQRPVLPDACAGFEDVEILQNVRESHQPQRSQESQTNPGPEQNNEIRNRRLIPPFQIQGQAQLKMLGYLKGTNIY